MGHAIRSGIDPSGCIEKCADRLLDVHIKDLGTISQIADPIEVGRGKLDIPGILRTAPWNILFRNSVTSNMKRMHKIHYQE